MILDDKIPQQRDDMINKIEAIILNRSSRKFWYIKYQIVFNNLDVKKGEESTKVLKSEKNLKFMQDKYLPAWIANKQNNDVLQNSIKKNLEYYAKIHLKEYEQFHDYQNMYYRTTRIIKKFGLLDITQINKHTLKVWLNELKNQTNGDELSKKSKLKYLTAFHKIFELACDDNAIEKNWTYEIKLAGKHIKKQEDIKPFSIDEVKRILEKSYDSSYGSLLHEYLGIAFFQGLSPHEILGLQIQDIDFIKKTIKIERGITKGKVKETKTTFRKREIPIFESTEHYLKTLIECTQKLNSTWLFCTKDGKHLNDIKDLRGDKEIVKDNYKIKKTTKWYKLLEDLNIEYRDLKNCRHTFAVRAIESKLFTLQEIANILGHSDLKMLLEHYAKWVTDKALHIDRSIKLF